MEHGLDDMSRDILRKTCLLCVIVISFLFALFQVAAVGGNKGLAELINSFTDKDIGTQKAIFKCNWLPFLMLLVLLAYTIKNIVTFFTL